MLSIRYRSAMWAAAGMAVALAMVWTLAAWRADAAINPNESTIVSVTPTRILDTRDPVNLGLAGPFVSPTSQKLQVTGSVPTTGGPAVVVPAGATGVLLNVTAVGPTAAGFVSVRPGDAVGAPTTSSLNVEAGANVPNAVQVALPTTGPDAGRINITYDAYGVADRTTDLLVDVVGYTTNAGLQQLDSRIAALEASRPSSTSATKPIESVTAADEVVLSVTMAAPVAGQVTVMSTSALGDVVAGDETRCSISTGVAVETAGFLQRWESGGPNSGQHAQLSGVRTFAIAAGATTTYNLVCNHVGPGSSNLESTFLSAIFIPAAPPV